jgi:hypothetical protein
MSFPVSIWGANAYHASALGVTDSAVPIYAMPDDGADTIGTAPSLICASVRAAPAQRPASSTFSTTDLPSALKAASIWSRREA